MKSATLSSKTYAVLMFLAVSVLAGLLLSGLAIPFAALASAGVNSASDSLKHLPADFETPPQSERSRILMADGEVLATFYDENRVYVPLKDISKHMQQAQVSIEDHRFFEHGAIDPEGFTRAFFKTLVGNTQGASTLTQQYVKLVRVETAIAAGDKAAAKDATKVSVARKIIEARYALAVEEKLSKEEILERYLNIAYYGDGAYGVEAAAQHYFGTTAKDLSLAQSAMLAGLVQNPVQLNPRTNTPAALERRNVVLNRMAELKVITAEEAANAKAETFDSTKVKRILNGCVSTRYPFLCDYVRRTLISDQMTSMGATKEERENTLKRGGLTIQTLIDPEAQDATQKAINDMVAPTDPVLAASVLLQPKTGLIVAMAQSRPVMGNDAAAGQTWYNINVQQSMGGAEGYQAGSTFKPFAVAAALEQGMTPSHSYNSPSKVVLDGWQFKNCQGSFRFIGNGKPVGNSGGAGYGVIDMRKATESSVNTYFMQLIRDVGICQTVKMAQRTGVQLANGEDIVKGYENYPSFVLGSGEVTPLSVAQAYATFANRGVRCDPIIVESVTNQAGKQLAVPSSNCTKVMEQDIADGVNYILEGVMNNGTGRPARMADGRPQAGKTGTTDSSQSVWFAGYTPELAGVSMIAVDKTNAWYETNKKSLSGMRLPSGTYLQGSGGGDAGQIWKQAMAAASRNLPKTSFVSPGSSVLEGVKIPLPNVSGMSYSEAQATLEAAGFQTQRWGIYSDAAPGTFLGISPRTSATKFSTIRLQVSLGPRPQAQPDPVAPAPPAEQPSSDPAAQQPATTTSGQADGQQGTGG